jgi:hypothetical protein
MDRHPRVVVESLSSHYLGDAVPVGQMHAPPESPVGSISWIVVRHTTRSRPAAIVTVMVGTVCATRVVDDWSSRE